MSILPGVLETAFYEEIRDKIAEILTIEVPAQGALLADPKISGINRIYVERSVDFSSQVIPGINVIFEKVDFGDETSIGKQFTAEYAVDVYGMSAATATGRADEKANKFVQKLAALVEGILSYGGYMRLGFGTPTVADPKGISNRKVYDIQFFNPNTNSNAEMIVRARVRIRVSGNQPKLVVEPTPLAGADTQVVLFNSNESYFYTNDEVIPPVVTDPCEPVIVQNSTGSWEVTQLSGTTLTLSDTSVRILNTLGSVLDSVDVVYNEPKDVEIPNITITDSTGSDVSHPAGEDFVCTPVSPATITLDGAPLATVPSGGTFDAKLVDQNDATITPISIISGVIKVDQTPPPQRKTAKLMQTGQPVSYITGDAADNPQGRAVDFLTLDSAPVHDDQSPTINTTTNRFTDELGGQTYTSGIILDWSTWDGSELLGWQNNFQLGIPVVGGAGYMPLASAISFCNSFSLGGFSGWHQCNFEELNSLYRAQTNCMNYPPFNSVAVNYLWTNTTFSTTVGCRLRQDTARWEYPITTGNNANPFPCRYFYLSTTNILS